MELPGSKENYFLGGILGGITFAAIFLIGPDGRLLAQHLRGEAIAIAVRQVLRGGGGAENQDTPAPQPSVE